MNLYNDWSIRQMQTQDIPLLGRDYAWYSNAQSSDTYHNWCESLLVMIEDFVSTELNLALLNSSKFWPFSSYVGSFHHYSEGKFV